MTKYKSAFLLASLFFVLILSVLCLWLCVRAASPKQPRRLASWRDWKNWAFQPHQGEASGA